MAIKINFLKAINFLECKNNYFIIMSIKQVENVISFKYFHQSFTKENSLYFDIIDVYYWYLYKVDYIG